MTAPALASPTSLDEAVRALAEAGGGAEPLAGATWVMRALQRGEGFAPAYVSLRGLPELAGARIGERASLGTLLTHDELGRLEPGCGPLGALAQAARASAFPAVRAVATLGGNICARGFVEADLTPALLALGAEVEVASAADVATLPLDDYLDRRPAGIVTRVTLPLPAGRRSAYERLTVRGGGEYPVCGVAVALELAAGSRRIAAAAVAATSLAERPLLLPAAAAALAGVALADEAAVLAAGRAGCAGLPERDGLDAPGWYRLAVLPALLRDAVARIAGEAA